MVKSDPEGAREAFKAVAEASAPLCPSCRKPVKHRKGVDWCRDHRMSEASLQSRIVYHAKKRGWVVKHVGKGSVATDAAGNAVIVSSAKSFPDLFLLHEGQRRALAIECKREDGEFEPGQLEYLQLLNICGIPAVVIRPSHLREGVVDAILDRQ